MNIINSKKSYICWQCNAWAIEYYLKDGRIDENPAMFASILPSTEEETSDGIIDDTTAAIARVKNLSVEEQHQHMIADCATLIIETVPEDQRSGMGPVEVREWLKVFEFW